MVKDWVAQARGARVKEALDSVLVGWVEKGLEGQGWEGLLRAQEQVCELCRLQKLGILDSTHMVHVPLLASVCVNRN